MSHSRQICGRRSRTLHTCGVTSHWLDENWELQSAILQTRECSERHTGENISIRLQACADEWKIETGKIAATVHDNGSNINRAMDFLDAWPDQRCFAHTLQLANGAGLKVQAIARLLGAARRLAAHFKRSTVAGRGSTNQAGSSQYHRRR